MTKGKCPRSTRRVKCGSQEVYVKHYKSADILGGAAGRTGEQDDYVCTDCGYSEQYIVDKEALKVVRGNWTKAG